MSSTAPTRTFVAAAATRERVPLLIGLVGPSGSGKTYSALRLATGIQRIAGGDIYVIDTEARRALHYAPQAGEKANPAKGTFAFRHLPFGAPFSSLDYLAAIEHCVKAGARTIIVDSASHEHEGPGGVLEEHASEVERLSKAWNTSADKAQIPAWSAPKRKRRQLLNALLQMSVNFIFCFRAKEKIKIKSGEKPRDLGFMPIAGEEFVYEMALNCLLMPGSGGVPSWHPEEMGERAMVKLPEQFKAIFEKPQPLSEEIGVRLAEWASGSNGMAPEPQAVLLEEMTATPVKRGGKDVTAFLVRSADGREFGTFDQALAERAKAAIEMKLPVLITHTVSQRGGLLLETLAPAEVAA